MSALEQLLGESVMGKGEEPVPVESLAGKGKVIGLYFSAHWCEPCRLFTPTLVKFYENLKLQEDKPFEVVFLSSDKDGPAFDEYYSEMPWLAVPHGDSRKEALSKKYKVRGIPTLVFLDGESGEVITKQGRSIVDSDEEGDDYPWVPPNFAEVMNGAKLINSKKEEFDAAEALDGKVKGLYFSAHWCPPCQTFTPQLVETYNKLKDDGKNLEIVFISSDEDDDAFQDYLKTMPWLALPFESQAQKKLELLFEIDGIPMLIILDENDKLITENARRAVEEDPEGKEFPWLPKPLSKVGGATIDVLYDEMCVLLLGKGGDSETEDELRDAMQGTAERYFKKQGAPKFFYGCAHDGDDTMESLLEYLGISEPQYPMLLCIDMSEEWKNFQQGISVSIKEVVEATLLKYDEGKLEKESIVEGEYQDEEGEED